MATDARGHTVPASTDHPERADLTALSLSIGDAIPVANVTARAALIVTLTGLGITASTSNPITVFRADAPPGLQNEFTTDGSTWLTILAGSIYAHASRASNAGIANTTVTNISWDAPTLAGGITCASNTTFTIPVAGRYNVSFGTSWATNATGVRNVWILQNTARVIEADGPGSSVTSTTCLGSRVLTCAAGDTISMAAYQTSGGSINLTGSAYMFLTIDYVGTV